jgi:hypothetical protein
VEKEEEISIADVEDILSWRQLSSSDELKRSIDNDDEVKNVTDSLAASVRASAFPLKLTDGSSVNC